MYPNPPSNLPPLGAFPDTIQHSIAEIQHQTGAPSALIAVSLLGAMSTATQWRYDVRLLHGAVRPTSLIVVALADSGDRKSTVDRLVFKQHYALEKQIEQLAAARNQTSKTDLELWLALRKRLIKEITKRELTYDDVDEFRTRLREHEANKPATARAATLMLANATERAFIEAIEGDGQIVTLISDEGATLINSPLFASSAVLNQAWDGNPKISVNRAKEDQVVARSPRVSVIMKIQPAVWSKVMASKRGQAMRDNGFCARMLLALIDSNQGYRPPSPMNDYDGPSQFYESVDHLAQTHLARMKSLVPVALEILELSPGAKYALSRKVAAMEPRLAVGGALYDSRDFASKYAEHVCRIAAALHAFTHTDPGLVITEDTIQRAIVITSWFGGEFEKVFGLEGPLSALAADSQKLLKYVQRTHWSQGAPARMSEVGREGPVRPKSRVMECAKYLSRHYLATLVPDREPDELLVPFTSFFQPPPPLGCVLMLPGTL